MEVLLIIIATVVGGAVGFRIGLHVSAVGIWHGAKRRLDADEWHTFDVLMDKALGGGK